LTLILALLRYCSYRFGDTLTVPDFINALARMSLHDEVTTQRPHYSQNDSHLPRLVSSELVMTTAIRLRWKGRRVMEYLDAIFTESILRSFPLEKVGPPSQTCPGRASMGGILASFTD
jgi:hypothetical protein